MLHAETRGRPDGQAVVLLHGFTQSGRSWGPVGDAIAAEYRVTAIDAPGHGRSATVQADLHQGADLMAQAAARGESPDKPAAWLGYSMGGRYALHVALRHPGAVRRMVLVSATAGIEDPVERIHRRDADNVLADRVEAEGLEAFVRRWLQQPMFAALPASATDVESRLGGTPEGLASSLRLAGTGTQKPLWNHLRDLTMPVLIVAGENDAKYVDLAMRLADGIGATAELALIHGAGHACHLEQPRRFLDAVMPFLRGG